MFLHVNRAHFTQRVAHLRDGVDTVQGPGAAATLRWFSQPGTAPRITIGRRAKTVYQRSRDEFANKFSIAHYLAQTLGHGHIDGILCHVKLHAVDLSCLHHARRFGHIHGHRLFHQHVLARLGRCNCLRTVQRMRRTN